MTPPAPLPWLAIAGPTASGKTALTLGLAQRTPIEIISVDSALVYQGMDIGTAKPTAAELAAVPHHLIDILPPTQAYSAAQFVKDAQDLVRQIQARGRLPVLAGGTMLYFKALFDGLDDMPPAQPELRAQIEAEAQTQGWPALHTQLAQVDPSTAQRLAPNDAQRIARALEVFRATGQPISAFQRRQHHPTETQPLRINGQAGLLLALEPHNRAWLHQRIAERFDAMLAQHFLQEMHTLRARGDLNPDLPSMRCVGYRQAWEWLDAQAQAQACGQPGPPVNTLRDLGIFATRQLAKRQLTWLRSMPQRQVVAVDEPQALENTLAYLQKTQHC